ncbi:MAG: RNA polymerase sigma factor [Egibacteraceae bacterium]
MEQPEPSTATLVAGALKGDEDAWSAIVHRYEGLVTAVARRHRLGAAEIDDVTQATWAQLVSHLERIREPACLPGWLATTAARESLRLIRGQGRERPVDVAEYELPSERRGPEAQVVAEDEHERLHAAVSRLPGRYRPLVDLLLTQETPSYAEIAVQLDLPVGSIGPMRARGCALLRRDASLAEDAQTRQLVHQ